MAIDVKSYYIPRTNYHRFALYSRIPKPFKALLVSGKVKPFLEWNECKPGDIRLQIHGFFDSSKTSYLVFYC